jgi:hypothetical protein
LNELQFKLREAHHSRKARRLEPAGHCRRLGRLARRRPLRTIIYGWVGAEAVMDKPNAEFDYERYRRLLAEATDEPKRLALIDLLVKEKAKDSLALQSIRERVAELGLTRSNVDDD